MSVETIRTTALERITWMVEALAWAIAGRPKTEADWSADARRQVGAAAILGVVDIWLDKRYWAPESEWDTFDWSDLSLDPEDVYQVLWDAERDAENKMGPMLWVAADADSGTWWIYDNAQLTPEERDELDELHEIIDW